MGDEVSDRHFNGVNFVVVNRQAVDDGFVSEAADFEDELQGGLAVSVSEGVIGCCRGVPFFRKWWWVFGVRCRFLSYHVGQLACLAAKTALMYTYYVIFSEALEPEAYGYHTGIGKQCDGIVCIADLW